MVVIGYLLSRIKYVVLYDRFMFRLVFVEHRVASACPPMALPSGLMAVELAGVAEIAEMLNTTRRTVQRWTLRGDFPNPVSVLAGDRRVWRRSDVEGWAQEHLPLPRPGRPPKTR